MSERPLREVAERLEMLISITGDMGSGLLSPFAALSFLSLPVIPEIRLTDLGLVDVLENRLL
jgi:adenine deaminase